MSLAPIPLLWLLLETTLGAAPASAREDPALPILHAVNVERAAHRAPALRLDPTLSAAAQARAEEVAAEEDLGALDSTGEAIGRGARARGYDFRLIGEIVLVGDGLFEERLARLRESDPEAFADAMRPGYRDLGLGIAERDGRLVRALFFGLSAGDDFAQKTAALGDLGKVRRRLLREINAERLARKLPPLRENSLLDRAAQAHAADMIRRCYYAHESPEGTTVLERARQCGYRAARVGENLAEGPPTVGEVMDGWMKSPAHREHILSLSLNEIGMGVAFGKNARGYEIVWVQVFGAPR
jgi:uncharacterized protein YkwD